MLCVLQQLEVKRNKEIGEMEVKGLSAASPCQKGAWVHPSVQGKSAHGQPEGAGPLTSWWGAGGGSWCWVPPELWLCALGSSRYTGRQCWSCDREKRERKKTSDCSAWPWTGNSYSRLERFEGAPVQIRIKPHSTRVYHIENIAALDRSSCENCFDLWCWFSQWPLNITFTITSASR